MRILCASIAITLIQTRTIDIHHSVNKQRYQPRPFGASTVYKYTKRDAAVYKYTQRDATVYKRTQRDATVYKRTQRDAAVYKRTQLDATARLSTHNTANVKSV